MRKIPAVLIIILVSTLFSCKKTGINGNVPLTGNWVAVQDLADPGDGSGTWQPLQVKTTAQFSADGSVSGTAFEGYTKYVVKDSITLTFTKPDKSFENFYYQIKHDTLTMSPAGPVICFEPCGTKFKKQ